MITNKGQNLMQNDPQAVVPEEIDESPVVIDTYDTEALKKHIETLNAQKKHWRDKAKKEAEEKAALLAKPQPSPQLIEEKPKFDFKSLMAVQNATRSLDEQELSEMTNEAESLNIDPVKYITSNSGKSYLEMIRKNKKSNEATPAPSNKVPVFNGKPVRDILGSKTASESDKKAAFDSIIKKSRNNAQ